MGNERAAEKREILKMDYPKNLLYAVRGGWEDEKPTELTQDVLSGIQYALSTLNDREQYILYERYREKRTLSSIGEELGVISERVRQIESKALRNLRYSRRINDINSVNGLVKKFNKVLFGKTSLQADVCDDKENCLNDTSYPISFSDVSLVKGNKRILNHIELAFEPKKKYLIIGRNGAGKSSMLRLLKGYDTEYTGKILIDGAEMKTYDSEALSKKIVYINEQVSLFCDSILNNITMYKEYSDESISAAIKTAGLKVNLDRVISDGEVNLSSGEQRRIELARAYLSNAPVLVFDEAISTLDIQTAYGIEKTMLEMEDRTIIFVSHNFSSSLIRKYDAIILLSDGEIIDVGSVLNCVYGF